jgi:LacI family transcriptional regulator
MGVIHGAWERGVDVPGALSVIGFDDIPLASATVPSLTTVKMPIAEIAAAGVDLAIGDGGWAAQEDGEAPRLVFQPQLIVRASTAAVPDAKE